jgi:hypothetical protein
LAGIAVLDDAFGGADVQIADEQVRRLVVIVARYCCGPMTQLTLGRTREPPFSFTAQSSKF